MTRLRVEVEDRHGSTALFVDSVLEELPADMREQLTTDVARMIQALGTPDAAAELIATLTRQQADSLAYGREAARRGVLPL